MPDKVYTRKGDDGTTQLLFGGKDRVLKSGARVSAYGECDEAVSALGLARAEADADVAALILRLQQELFVVNAELATDPGDWDKLKEGLSLVTQDMVDALEADIDRLTDAFEQPKDFIVPGNSRVGAALDHAARVVRRAERAVVALSRADEVRAEVLGYLNRLADLAWVLARYAERTEHQPRPR